MKFSKQKQKLYNKFLKSRTKENEVMYKGYKNIFQAIRKIPKKTYQSELFTKYKNDIKISGKIINEIISTRKINGKISQKN